MRKLIFIMIALLIYSSSQAQMMPKRIKSKSDYVHSKTRLVFPLKVKQFDRTEIYTWDSQRENIGVSYRADYLETDISVYLYPAGAGTDYRLREEYLKSLQSITIAYDSDIKAQQFPVSYKNEGYTINGFKAIIENLENNSILSIYECGKWYFKIRVTSEKLDTSLINQIEQSLLESFKPTQLVKNDPLKGKADINISDAAFIDTLMLDCVIGSAIKKVNWAIENIDSLERASGFPDLYLKMHIETLKEFSRLAKKSEIRTVSESTKDYLADLNALIENGYLEEFIMEQYNMIMIVPDDLELDFDSYYHWKLRNNIKINLQERLYVICYDI